MKVAEFQIFLRSLGEVMKASDARKAGNELVEFANALDAHKDKTLPVLGGILKEASGAAPLARRTGGGKAQVDQAKIQNAFEDVQSLLSRSLDPSLTREMIEAKVKPLERTLSSDEMKELARKLSIAPASKPRVVAAIIKKISDQRPGYLRGLE